MFLHKADRPLLMAIPDGLLNDLEQLALSMINSMLCESIQEQREREYHLPVQGNIILFPEWASGTVTVLVDGKPVSTSHDDTEYYKLVYCQQPDGTVATVRGMFGFKYLPVPLLLVVEKLVRLAYDNLDDDMVGEVSSKKIEDVQVNYLSTVQPILQRVLNEYRSVLLRWSVCADRYGIGTLSMPHHKYYPPYQVNPADWGTGVLYGRR